MDGPEEWLGFDPPWLSNDNLPDYWVVDATTVWTHRGLLGEVVTGATVYTYPTPGPEDSKNVVALTLTLDALEVGFALAELGPSEDLVNSADTVAIAFSPELIGNLAARSGWRLSSIGSNI